MNRAETTIEAQATAPMHRPSWSARSARRHGVQTVMERRPSWAQTLERAQTPERAWTSKGASERLRPQKGLGSQKRLAPQKGPGPQQPFVNTVKP